MGHWDRREEEGRVGKRRGPGRLQLGGLTLALVKSDLVSLAPTCRLKDTCLPGTSQKTHI